MNNESEEQFVKGKNIIYRDTDGTLKLDYSKLRKSDNRNFEQYVRKVLYNTKTLQKIEHISAFGYTVILVGSNFNKYDEKVVQQLLGTQAHVTSNLKHNNRDQSEITIKFNQNK